MTSNTLDREALYRLLCHVPGFGGVTIRGLKDTYIWDLPVCLGG